MKTVENDLQLGVNSIDTVLGQCMYFGLSFSRVGADFRGHLVPIFTRVILNNFRNSIAKVTRQFEIDIESYTLINKVPSGLKTVEPSSTVEDDISPPESLLDYHPLAIYCNGLLTAFNELRHCSPISLASDVTDCCQASLEAIGRNILNFYRQEQQAFSVHDRECLVRFCSCFAYDLIPYIQRCIHVLFAPNIVATHLGINVITLQKENVTFLKQKQICEPIGHLLPDRVESLKLNIKTRELAVELPSPSLSSVELSQ